MTILFIIYGMGVAFAFIAGVTLWWVSADEGTSSYDYKIAKTLVRYALIFPVGIVKVIDILEEEAHDHDL